MIKITKREVDKPRNDRNPNHKYSEKQKYEAVALYRLLGNLALVAKNLGIVEDTIRTWKVQDWWKDYEYEISQADRAKTSTKLTKIRDKAIEVVMDRLESGDFHYNQKSGTITKIPIKANIANQILKDSIDKEVLLDKMNQEVQRVSATEKIADRLLIIQQRFQEMTQRALKQPESDVIDMVATPGSSDPQNPTYEVLDDPERITNGKESKLSENSQTPGQGETPTGESGDREEILTGTERLNGSKA